MTCFSIIWLCFDALKTAHMPSDDIWLVGSRWDSGETFHSLAIKMTNEHQLRHKRKFMQENSLLNFLDSKDYEKWEKSKILMRSSRRRHEIKFFHLFSQTEIELSYRCDDDERKKEVQTSKSNYSSTCMKNVEAKVIKVASELIWLKLADCLNVLCSSCLFLPQFLVLFIAHPWMKWTESINNSSRKEIIANQKNETLLSGSFSVQHSEWVHSTENYFRLLSQLHKKQRGEIKIIL